MPDDLYARLMKHFLVIARDALDGDAGDDEIVFEARVLYGQFLGWTAARTDTIH